MSRLLVQYKEKKAVGFSVTDKRKGLFGGEISH